MGILSDIKIVGLTGQSGAGKSTVSEIFKECGLSVINADAVARRAADNKAFLSEVKGLFPDCVSDSGLDRLKLAACVFNNKSALKSYTDLIFPYITKMIFNEIGLLKSSGEKIAVLDAPTLFESGLDEICSDIVSVIAPMDVKIERILKRDGIPAELVKSRLSSQNSENFFRSKSDYIIENNSDICELKRKAEAVAFEIMKSGKEKQ